jgi:DNA-binding NtrC family response regulator
VFCYLEWAVATFPGDRQSLAAKLGVSERTLYRKLKESTKSMELEDPGRKQE